MNWSVELEDGTTMINTGQTAWRKVMKTGKKVKRFMLDGKEIDNYCNRYMVFNQIHILNVHNPDNSRIDLVVFCGFKPDGEMIVRAFKDGKQSSFYKGDITHEMQLQMDEIGVDAV